MAFLPDGRLAISCWEPEGGIYLLDNVGPEADAPVSVTRIAEGLLEPLGLAAVDGTLYVLQKPELTALLDHDGDGRTDEYRNISSAWGVTQNFHEFAFGLAHADGALHGTLATAIVPGGASSPNQHLHRGRVFRVEPDGEGFRFLAAGLRTPNGIGLGPEAAIYVADNQGDWLPASKIVRIEEGAFFGNRSVDPEGTRALTDTPPVLWLPQFEIGNSPSQVGHFPSGPFRGQLLWGDVTHGGLKRGFVERVSGVEQGAVFRFTQGLEAGINRFAWGPDGSLYVGGIGSTGNWNQFGKEWFGLQRLRWNGRPSFEPLAVRVRPGGFEIELSEPLAEDARLEAGDVSVVHWRYVPTAAYGGPKVDEGSLSVAAVRIAADRTRIALDVPGLEEDRVVYLRLPKDLESAGGRGLWTHEAWYTLNRLPAAQ
jgi:cytochrome c